MTASGVQGISLVVPTAWHVIDLVDPGARRTAVAGLIRRQAGTSPALAPLRAELRAQLGRTCARAASAGGLLMAVSLMTSGDMPIPASVTIYRVPGLRLDEEGMVALRQEGTVEEDWSVADTGRGQVVRRVGQTRGASSLGAERIPMLAADYWVQGGDEAVHLSFSTTMVQIGSAMLELFDGVAASVELEARVTAGAGVQA